MQTGVSSRHLSCVETGRAQPSRQLILFLAHQLDVPLRERNTLLLSAGYAPAYTEQALDNAGSDMTFVRDALDHLLASHDPWPAFVINRRWDVVARNKSTDVLLVDVAPHLLVAPVNALRLALHPAGLAPRIVNLAQWGAYLLRRIDHQVLTTGAADLAALAREARSYPNIDPAPSPQAHDPIDRVFVPLHVRSAGGDLRFLNMVATFGTALDVTAAELVIEAFFPADAATTGALSRG